MTTESTDAIRKNLVIHSVALALLAGGYAVVLWHAESTARDGLANLGLVLLILPLLGYALLTSLLMLGLSRRRHAAAVLHAIGLSAAGIALATGRSVERKHAAATATADTEPAACVKLGPIRVQTGVRMSAELTVTNSCATVVVIGDVDLNGFAPTGGNTIFSGEHHEPIELPPGGSHVARVTEVIDGEAGRELDAWDWRSNVDFEGPDGRLSCFATVGAPATRGCTILDRGVLIVE